MLNLTIGEQKQILGGAYLFTIYTRDKKRIINKRAFATVQQGQAWARSYTQGGCVVDYKRI